ncbi:NADPH oxidase organizer 1-like isoform X1 [Electrophorus electricus]|uniref:NADPH oxidase organizer 1-like isoform X1 n=1 Tax=Electrophorus electricus TaxID=8005 RepID=UPI0015D0581D|nr:NADPH oxidase organizer 1-like isoform X1 [Electrophorus electricus]
MADRFPIDVRINGIMYKDKTKMYMTSVLWSDQTEVTVCRSLQDFKEFHKRLKKQFAVDNQRERVLPRFRGQMLRMNFQKSPAMHVRRGRALEKYCTELLNCDPSISGAADVIQFFLPKEQELQPEFVQNSVMIFQPEAVPNGLASRKLSSGNVTQPYVTQTYRCVAPYETKDTNNRPFNVAVNETLDVLIKDQAGWWLVENESKCLAWFPAPFLEICEDEEEDDELDNAAAQTPLYCAARSYTAKTRDELSVAIGTVLEVLQKSDNGWWLARYNGKTGYVPSMHLRPYTDPMSGLQKKLYCCTLNQTPTATLEGVPERECSTPAQYDRSNSCSDSICSSSDGMDVRFHSVSSMGSSFEDEEDTGKPESDSESDSAHSGVSGEPPSPTDSESSRLPRMPPRPRTREILSRCTTYTRKAALATQSQLFPERFGPNN